MLVEQEKDARARTNQERQDQEEYGRDISEQKKIQLAPRIPKKQTWR